MHERIKIAGEVHRVCRGDDRPHGRGDNRLSLIQALLLPLGANTARPSVAQVHAQAMRRRCTGSNAERRGDNAPARHAQPYTMVDFALLGLGSNLRARATCLLISAVKMATGPSDCRVEALGCRSPAAHASSSNYFTSWLLHLDLIDK